MKWTRQVWPVIHIERDLRTGQYRVQPYTEGPVATTAFGEPAVIAPGEFESQITDAVMTNLAKFGKEKYDEKRAIRRASNEQRQYVKGHLEVSVRKQPSGELVIFPLHREGGGFVAYKDESTVLAAEEVRDKLPEAIAEAFRKST
jgi:hypothetical protein